MKTGSIRFRLTAWYAGLLTLASIALGTLFFVHFKNYLEDTILETQTRRARQIAETLVANLRPTDESRVAQEVEALYAPEKGDRFIRISGPGGAAIYRSGPPNDQTFAPADVAPASPSPLREFTEKQRLAGGATLLLIGAVRVTTPAGASYLVEVGVSGAAVEAMFRHLLLLLGLGLPCVIFMAALGGYALVRRALNPVERLASTAEQISQHNLSERLPVPPTGDELERLSLSLNHMISRLDDAFQNSKRFVADASHELRTPLTILRGELEGLAQDESYSAGQRERLGSLLEEVERLSKIVERLFALSRLDAGEAQTEWVAFDLAELVATTTGQMSLLAEDKGISLVCEAAQPVPVMGDRARLKQVVVNLLDNAIKYTPEGGAVMLRAGGADGIASFEVADTGPGISAEARPHIFDRFYRADRTRSRDPGGAGLGLAIVKSICHAHGGDVEAESAVGRGSRFRVRLPLSGLKFDPGKSP